MNQDLISSLDFLFEPELIKEISQVGNLKSYTENEELITIGQNISFFPIIITGSIKIITENKDGNELLLYYLERGDTCSMTLQCCLGNSKSKITALTEIPTDLIMIPIAKMEEWIIVYKSWRHYVFNSYHERMEELLQSIDNLAFHDLESRLFMYLKDKVMTTGQKELNLTHQKIASELNTSRVVISRLMKKLEINGQLKMNRKSIQLTEYS